MKTHFTSLLVIAALILTSCSEKPVKTAESDSPFKLLTFIEESEDTAQIIFHPFGVLYPLMQGYPVQIPTLDNQFISYPLGEYPIFLDTDLYDTLKFKYMDHGLMLNEELFVPELNDSIKYRKNLEFIDKKMGPLSKSVILVDLHSSVKVEEFIALLPSDTRVYQEEDQLIKYTVDDTVRWIYIGGDGLAKLADPQFKNLEHLVISDLELDTSVVLDFFPRLKQVELYLDHDSHPFVVENFLSANPALERISIIMAEDMIDYEQDPEPKWGTTASLYLPEFREHKDLKVLQYFSDEIHFISPSYNFFEVHPKLVGLDLNVYIHGDLSNSLAGAEQLQYLSLRPYTLPDPFKLAELPKLAPNLEYLSLLPSSQTGTDYTPLLELRKLKYLSVTDIDPADTSLFTFDHLQALNIMVPADDEDEFSKRLREELPDTNVGIFGPFCMGSGWILLLVPLVYLIRRVQRKKDAA